MNTAVAPTDAPYMGQQSGGSMKMRMAPGLPVPMPNLSGQANGLVGVYSSPCRPSASLLYPSVQSNTNMLGNRESSQGPHRR